ncbi:MULTISPECIES: hypothetical protein [Lysinibacillus]|uniref:hypothetical protein n=1 Tax=Lysinibacillus TaxID=400634 RepID=UPI00214B5019|nr:MULTISPECIES: hypothetical protein [Lysinibacillus]UUV25829.1 hypothetical protein NP781_04225 [Lysinibacillus sp. FN11]UYB48703.1 hypothetical protein OCI51_07020 [Lysinibacillus capsici]
MTKTIINFTYNDGTRKMIIDGKYISKLNDHKVDDVIPFINKLSKEVNCLSKKNQKKFYKTLQVVSLSIIPILHSTKKAHAQQMSNYPLLNNKESDLLPPEIVDILKQLILACGTISVALAILFLMGAGVYRMVGNKVKAREWTVDIIKGFGQVLLAPVIILILATLTALIFKNVHGLEAFF